MDNNMNFNNVGNTPGVGPAPMNPVAAPAPETPMGPAPVEMPQAAPVDMNAQPMNQMPQDMNNNVGVSNLPGDQNPSQVFGTTINNIENAQSEFQDIINPVGDTVIQPKYGAMTNDNKQEDTNVSNTNMIFVIIIGVIMFGFILLLPTISDLLG